MTSRKLLFVRLKFPAHSYTLFSAVFVSVFFFAYSKSTRRPNTTTTLRRKKKNEKTDKSEINEQNLCFDHKSSSFLPFFLLLSVSCWEFFFGELSWAQHNSESCRNVLYERGIRNFWRLFSSETFFKNLEQFIPPNPSINPLRLMSVLNLCWKLSFWDALSFRIFANSPRLLTHALPVRESLKNFQFPSPLARHSKWKRADEEENPLKKNSSEAADEMGMKYV